MIPRNLYESDHEAFRDTVTKYVETEIVPHHEQWEEDGMISRAAWEKAGELGLLCSHIPEEYGGLGVDFRFSAIVIEELAKVGATGPGFSLHSDIVAPYLLHYGTEDQKKIWLPKMAKGEVITAVAMSEPAAGSDLAGIKTRAIADGDDYIINGSKTFITNGQMADLILVVCKTEPELGPKGTSLFLVEANREGFSRGRNLKKIGLKAQDTSELFFDNVRVPKTNLVGELNRGFIYLMQELPQERLTVAIIGIATAQGVLKETLAYVNDRKAFGKRVADFQTTRHKLAEIATEIDVTQTYVDRCTELHLKRGLTVEAAASAKLWATEVQCRVIDECLQLHGGYGYMWEYPVARAWADARAQRIYAGTSEIMKEIISRPLVS